MAHNLNYQQKQIWRNVGHSFDIISATSTLEAYLISSTFNCPIENVLVIGQQRSTPEGPFKSSQRAKANSLVKSLYGSFPEKYRLIVYAPTHRDHIAEQKMPVPFGFINYEKLNEVLLANKSRLLIRTHPLSNTRIEAHHSNIVDCSLGPPIDFNQLAPAIDFLITDYSGIFIDFLNSDIRLAFWQYDLEKYRKARGFSISESIFESGFCISGPRDFEEFISNNKQDSKSLSSRTMWSKLLKENTYRESRVLTLNAIKNRIEMSDLN